MRPAVRKTLLAGAAIVVVAVAAGLYTACVPMAMSGRGSFSIFTTS